MAFVNKKGFWREFIALYRECPELWQVKSDIYKNRHMKDAAYEKLVKKMREVDPYADRALVRMKINTLRTSYRRELKKIDGSVKSGIGGDDVYVPNLWYFVDLDFLRDQTQMQGTSKMDNENEDDDESDGMNESVIEEDSLFQPPQPQPICKPKVKEAQKRKAPTENEETKRARLLDIACQRLQNPISDSEIIAKGWGIEFNKMRPDQQLYAKKFIDDILFEGRLGNLHRNSILINPSSP
ncbi:hypothetical protein FQA39_LY01177 [Lamprigera yunnana]|nr:hypothetical protein FQA39_LY01177 [Lamprigera yunnana]